MAVDDDTLIASMVGESDDGHLAFGARFIASFGRAVREGWCAEVSGAMGALRGVRPERPEVLAGSGTTGPGAGG